MRGRAAGSRGNFMATEYIADVFRRLRLQPSGGDGTYFQEVPPSPGASSEYASRNVIAVLPGSDPALRGQYVLVGAHNDHVGMVPDRAFDHDALRAFNRVMRPQGANDRPGQPTPEQQARIDSLIARARSIRPPRPDTVMNGADDDASGTAVLLEIAERFATESPPLRSIVFISHAAEEGGLLGSRYFTDNPTVPLDSIVAAHNMDMLGNGGVTDVKFGGPAQVQMLGARRLSQEFGDVIDSLNAVREETMAIDYSWDRTNALNRFCRSDQVSYFRHTIPVTYFSTGYSIDYHQATDEPQYIDYDHSARVGRFVHEIMSAVANRPTRLRVLPPEERDMSSQCER
jgi:Zn-dependent M28 family amino/carboxypeptidase